MLSPIRQSQTSVIALGDGATTNVGFSTLPLVGNRAVLIVFGNPGASPFAAYVEDNGDGRLWTMDAFSLSIPSFVNSYVAIFSKEITTITGDPFMATLHYPQGTGNYAVLKLFELRRCVLEQSVNQFADVTSGDVASMVCTAGEMSFPEIPSADRIAFGVLSNDTTSQTGAPATTPVGWTQVSAYNDAPAGTIIMREFNRKVAGDISNTWADLDLAGTGQFGPNCAIASYRILGSRTRMVGS